MYSSVISRPVFTNHSWQASSSSSMVEYSAHGMILRRSSSNGACSESASVTGISKEHSLRIAGGRPTVETVMRRAPMPRPHSALMVRIACVTFAKFASGSPMPMKTTFETRPTPSRRPRRQTCSTMRPAERLPSSPPMPDAQKRQPTGQPIWLDTHAVLRSSVGMRTVSVWRSRRVPAMRSAPSAGASPASGHSMRSFCVSSVATWWRMTAPCRPVKRSVSLARASFERSDICAKSTMPFS